MKLSLGTLKASEAALAKLVNSDIPVSAAVKLSRLVRQIQPDLAMYDKLVHKYGKPNATGDRIEVTKENFEAYAKEVTELNAVEIDFSFEPISVESLGDIKMTAIEMMLLEEFVK